MHRGRRQVWRVSARPQCAAPPRADRGTDGRDLRQRIPEQSILLSLLQKKLKHEFELEKPTLKLYNRKLRYKSEVNTSAITIKRSPLCTR